MTNTSNFNRAAEFSLDAIVAILAIDASADLFFLHAQAVGIDIAREETTIEQVGEWRDQLLTMRRTLVRNMKNFWRFARGGKSDLVWHPEDIPEVANIDACHTTTGILRMLCFAVCKDLKQHPSSENLAVVELLNDHINCRIEQRPYEEWI